MKKYICIIVLLVQTFYSEAQRVEVESLNSEDYKVLQYEGWDLEYTSTTQEFFQFGIKRDGKVLVLNVDKGYELSFLNSENLIVKSKTVKFAFSKMRKGVPVLYSNYDNLMFGPSDGKYLEIQLEKQRFKKRRYPSSLRKSKSSIPLMYKSNASIELAASAVFIREDNELRSFLVNYGASPYDTLYRDSYVTDVLSMNTVNPSIQFYGITESKEILLINNLSGDFLLINYEEGHRKSMDLDEYGFNNSKYSKEYSCKLLKDDITGHYYLYYNPFGSQMNRLFRIETSDFSLSEIEISKLASHRLQVHDSKLYDMFFIENLESTAIYSMPLK